MFIVYVCLIAKLDVLFVIICHNKKLIVDNYQYIIPFNSKTVFIYVYL